MQETTARTEQSNRNSEVLQTHTTPEGTVSLTSKHRVPKHCPEHRAELCKVPVPPAAVCPPSRLLLAACAEMLSFRSKYAHIWFVLLVTIGARCELIPQIHCLSTVMGKMQLKA